MKTMKRIQSIGVFLTALFLIAHQPAVQGRTYKTLTGIALEGSFVDLKKVRGTQIVVLHLDRTGKPYELALSSLSLSDQKFIKFTHLTNRAKGITPHSKGEKTTGSKSDSLPLPSGPTDPMLANLSSKLVALDGRRLKKHKMQQTPDYYALYFAASWCSSCAHFTPKLTNYYNYNISFANPKFEVIFISRDNSENEMENYMIKSEMPWPALRYTDPAREKLRKKYAPRATPSLVLVDRAGKVISDSVVDDKYRSAFSVKQDMAVWFTDGERNKTGVIKSSLTPDKRVSGDLEESD